LSWKISEQRIKENIHPDNDNVYVIQGFVGGTFDGSTTTLGREGSDFTAAILGSVLNAESVTLWKDVQGILNADPASFHNPQKLEEISYLEAVELAFFGAKVIHPKTIKPLYNQQIPLFVKSFVHPDSIGTIIHSVDHAVEMIPVYVKKEHQILVSLRPRDLSFMIEQSFGHIFSVFNRNKVKINLVQTSATTLSICADNHKERIDNILDELNEKFRITFNHEVQLVTIRHYTDEAIHLMISKKQVLIEQKSRQTVHFVLRDNKTG
jgi:aspartate kinase